MRLDPLGRRTFTRESLNPEMYITPVIPKCKADQKGKKSLDVPQLSFLKM